MALPVACLELAITEFAACEH